MSIRLGLDKSRTLAYDRTVTSASLTRHSFRMLAQLQLVLLLICLLLLSLPSEACLGGGLGGGGGGGCCGQPACPTPCG